MNIYLHPRSTQSATQHLYLFVFDLVCLFSLATELNQEKSFAKKICHLGESAFLYLPL